MHILMLYTATVLNVISIGQPVKIVALSRHLDRQTNRQGDSYTLFARV